VHDLTEIEFAFRQNSPTLCGCEAPNAPGRFQNEQRIGRKAE
jgi:hypothetical protein